MATHENIKFGFMLFIVKHNGSQVAGLFHIAYSIAYSTKLAVSLVFFG